MADLDPHTPSERIDLADEHEFELGGMTVRPAERLVFVNGDRRELQPRIMQVLVALAKARPGVLSRDRLVEQCWDGRIVGDDALNRCILALRHLSHEFTPHPFEIETVPRIGHRLVGNGAQPAELGRLAKVRRSPLAPIAALLLLVLAVGLVMWNQRVGATQPASIAVLPFRDLSDDKAYFAEGVGEEILGRLSREPAFRVAGRASSAQFGDASDPRKVGRELGVDYILEGSVRSDAKRVRINASLVKASDGMRLWSETFDSTLDDVLDVQSAIGTAVASALNRELVHAGLSGRRPVNGEAYALYLNARGLIRSGNSESGQDALKLMRQVLRMDPRFAPAWSGYSEALMLDARTKGQEGLIAILPQARATAHRALQLDPNLAEPHAIMSTLLGSDSPVAIAHRRRAATLDPLSGEGLLWLGGAHEASGEWAEASKAYRRAHERDPIWPVPVQVLVDNAVTMGDRAGAEAVIKRELANDSMLQKFAVARVARNSGDFSDAARLWSTLADSHSQWASPSKLSLEDVLFMLKLSSDRPSRPPRPAIGQARSTPARIWMTAAPPAEEWRRRNRSWAAELVYRDENVIAAKLMLTAGRERELVATYNSPTGLLGIRPGERLGTCYLQSAAIAASALRAVGRGREADALLAEANALIVRAYRRGPVPLWFDDDAAGIWALQGKRDQAVDALERARRRGSTHATRTDLLGLADEPALRSLRGYPRFNAVVAKYNAHNARERAEIARALKLTA